MLADRASSLAKVLPHRGQGRAFLRLVLLLATIPGLCNLLSHAAPLQPHASTTATVSQDNADVDQPAVESPQFEPGALFSVASLEFDNSASDLVVWRPQAWTSSGIIPEGLVLSYLCDSARHQCSGVQLI